MPTVGLSKLNQSVKFYFAKNKCQDKIRANKAKCLEAGV
jgi:GTP cyclohydrolase I